MNGFRIKEIWAFTAIGDDNEEGIISMWTPGGGHMPMIASDNVRLKDLLPLAKRISKESGKRIELTKFSVREVVETLVPDGMN